MIRKIAWGFAAIVLVAAIALAMAMQRANTEFRPLDDEARALAPGQFVELTGGLTHYDVAGPETGPVVILVHGFSVPYYIWDTSFAALTDAGFRVIRYDLFGRGYSDRPDTDYNGELFERQIVDLIDALEIDEPVDVIGLSMGGAVTMRFAANNPELVRKIVLVDPSHKASQKPKWPQAIGSYLLALTYMPHAAEGQMTDFVYPENYPTWVDQYRVQMTYEGFRRAIVSTIYHFGTEDHLANYRKVQESGLPVKLIWGVEDQTLDISGADTVRAVLDVDYTRVEDAGHLPHIEKAEITNSAIVEFLSDVFES
jgi:pimeloyl-ACP methyl ester carboxylesterase